MPDAPHHITKQQGNDSSSPGWPAYWGVGPRIGVAAAIHFALTLLIDRLTWPRFRISFLSQPMALLIGGVLLVVGVVLYLLTTLHLKRAIRQRQLITSGPYAIVRHPLYTIGLLLLCPAVCILFRSYLVLTTPVTMALAMMWLIPREEKTLIRLLGEAYRDYQRRVPMLWPVRPGDREQETGDSA